MKKRITITKDEFEEGIKMHQFKLHRFAFSILRTDADAWNARYNANKRHLSTGGHEEPEKEFKSWMLYILADESKRLLKQNVDIVFVNDIQIYLTGIRRTEIF